jgi:dTMP kinase
MKGFFIAIEGIDAAGLSTQAQLLEKWLRKQGRKVLLTKEPTHGLIGGLIRAALRHEWKTNQAALQLLFSADRAHHLETEIIPALERGFVVICDRYVLSTLCYGCVDGVELDWLRSLNQRFPKPNLTIIIDVPSEVSIERMKKSRQGMELFEQRKKLARVRENFHKLRDELPNTFVVDGTKSVEEVHEAIKGIVKRFMEV